MNKIITTLCLPLAESKILLGMKKRGFGAGRWNGFGGKVGAGENIEEAAKRELTEECGLAANKLIAAGILNFEFETGEEPIEVHVFTTSEFQGVAKETEEMRPAWFELDNIPFGEMWPDDRHWLCPCFWPEKNLKAASYFRATTKL